MKIQLNIYNVIDKLIKGKKESAKLIKINSIALNIYNFYLTKTSYH
ncbi:hypothetical protein U728_2411 [Clostridium botulinum 202F]|nr:hypothetical protein [Clostridium sp. M14]AIY81575.1 hypothetical protein U728_2411 [Clostridium botulinum 202F]MBZ9693093.1 hypothetical protein [Clostridium sp. M14]